MKEQLITFETAKIAKEKGFDEKVRTYFIKTNHLKEKQAIIDGRDMNLEYQEFECILEYHNSAVSGLTKKDLKRISRPTQALLQKWLREKHKIYISLEHYWYNEWHYRINIQDDCDLEEKGVFDNYEQALEKALQEALKLI